MIEWINFITLLVGILLFCYLYTISLQPKKRSEKRGEKAWKECAIFRSVAGLLEFVITANTILWIWFPIPQLNFLIFPNWWISIIIGLAITVPGMIIMVKGMVDAGTETAKPSEETEMYGGIYRYIRHPQSLGEFPIFIALGFFVNSWTIVIIMSIFVFFYVPIMIYYEEKDLIRRFGEKYREYQKNTGALFPKMSSLRSSKD
jgi:protein-S-isoprenylcysteine O-methyltransferase Ste14